ncbi:MAG: CxxC-x17-CxxC domain-containing protein [Candidatus Falkowbacteria bacterium]
MKKTDEVVQVAQCNGCGQKTRINFAPTSDRPVFCKECLKEYRRQQALLQQGKKFKLELEKDPTIKKIKAIVLKEAGIK